MTYQLTEPEARVLGALIEKDMATPEYYPLSLNALVNACNQKSNRNPVVHYNEATVAGAIEKLRDKQLAAVLTGRDHRVPKYRHWAWETLALGRREMAVICVLLLRGPQTVGELKERTHRMYAFDDIASVESCLRRLIEWTPDPFVVALPRAPGTREPRYSHLLCGEVAVDEAAYERPSPAEPSPPRSDPQVEALQARVADLEDQVRALREEFAAFRRQFE